MHRMSLSYQSKLVTKSPSPSLPAAGKMVRALPATAPGLAVVSITAVVVVVVAEVPTRRGRRRKCPGRRHRSPTRSLRPRNSCPGSWLESRHFPSSPRNPGPKSPARPRHPPPIGPTDRWQMMWWPWKRFSYCGRGERRPKCRR